jgi:hypothetical protein
MPLTHRGEVIKRAMTKEYGAKKVEQVFYASRNAGTISGVDALPRRDPIHGYMDAVSRGDAEGIKRGPK